MGITTFILVIISILYGDTCLALREPLCPRRETEILAQIADLQSDVKNTVEEVNALKERLNGRSGLRSSITVPYLTPPLQVAETETHGWQLVFRGSAGNSQSVYDAWTSGTGTSDIKPVTMERTYASHFRDPGIDSWSSYNIKFVKFALYKETRKVAYVIFNAEGRTYMDWFSKERVLASSWSHVTTTSTFNYFSILGDDSSALRRNFFINKQYAGCDQDIGYVVAIDAEGSCLWDKHPVYPQFLYSDINAADYWNRLQFGRADFLMVFVHRS